MPACVARPDKYLKKARFAGASMHLCTPLVFVVQRSKERRPLEATKAAGAAPLVRVAGSPHNARTKAPDRRRRSGLGGSLGPGLGLGLGLGEPTLRRPPRRWLGWICSSPRRGLANGSTGACGDRGASAHALVPAEYTDDVDCRLTRRPVP